MPHLREPGGEAEAQGTERGPAPAPCRGPCEVYGARFQRGLDLGYLVIVLNGPPSPYPTTITISFMP